MTEEYNPLFKDNYDDQNLQKAAYSYDKINEDKHKSKIDLSDELSSKTEQFKASFFDLNTDPDLIKYTKNN